MLLASYTGHTLKFLRPGGTSRGTFHQKDCWYVKLTKGEISGIGEVSHIPGLSVEDRDDMEIRLDHICKLIGRGEMDPLQSLPSLPGVQFALESALQDLENGGTRILFPSRFTEGEDGIPINGLIWMGESESLLEQIRIKLDLGYRVLKMKVGALSLEEEMEILKKIRSEYDASDLEIRLDANGAWKPAEVPGILGALAKFQIHSIEQPIGRGQPEAMNELCRAGIIPIVLDEELIGIVSREEREELLERIRPDYIIIKPGLIGGFSNGREWIHLAGKLGIGWWVTSALESNIGLSDISQWTYSLGVSVPQGLGTGQLYTNNIPSPLRLEGENLWYSRENRWDLRLLTD